VITQTIFQIAASYDCNTYGAGAYNNPSCQTVSSPLDSALAYTGTPVFAVVSIAVIIILVSVVLLLKKRRKKT
jgi:LPXTG-motif cell wall-anchored protein